MSGAPIDVLFASYYFPPVGGAGVQRSQKFVRYLPAEGFRPIVVAGPDARAGRWEPEDRDLVAELPPDLEVHRPASAPPAEAGKERLARWLGRPTARERWWARALEETAERACAARRPALVYASLSPFEGLAPSIRVARRLGVPLLADLRDPWALDEVRVYPSALHRRAALAAMGRELARADRILMNTPEALRAARDAFPHIPPERLDCLTNGYDAADFAGLAPRPPDGAFRIVHAGYLHSELGLHHRARAPLRRWLGGELWPIDFLGRSHWYLLRALERLQREEPALAERIELHLLGVLSPCDEEIVRRSPFAARVRTPGYLDHRATVAALVAADLLFLPMAGLPPGRRARIVPGKTYEYLASGRPILAAVPEGDARDFVQAAGAGRVVLPDDVAGMARALAAFAAEAPAPLRPRGSETSGVRRFERRVLTGRLAEHFRELLGVRGTRPAACARG